VAYKISAIALLLLVLVACVAAQEKPRPWTPSDSTGYITAADLDLLSSEIYDRVRQEFAAVIDSLVGRDTTLGGDVGNYLRSDRKDTTLNGLVLGTNPLTTDSLRGGGSDVVGLLGTLRTRNAIASAGATIHLYEGRDNGIAYVGIAAPAAISSSPDSTWTLTLPLSRGQSGQVLVTDGAGVTHWMTLP